MWDCSANTHNILGRIEFGIDYFLKSQTNMLFHCPAIAKRYSNIL